MAATQRLDSDASRFPIYEQYLRNFGIDDKKDERHERQGREWTTRRCCHQDWLVSVFVIKWNRVRYEVGLFLAEDLYLLERSSGVKAGLMFLLSDAYYQTGRMELTFCGPANGKASFQTGHESDVPWSIEALAAELGVAVEKSAESYHNIRRTRLSDKTGRALYARITGFSQTVVDALNRPGSSVDLTRACFITQRGVWSPEQVEFLAGEALNPARLLEGGISPENRLSFQHDLIVLRTAVAWERAKTILEKLSGAEEALVTPVVWNGNLAEFFVGTDLSIGISDGTKVKVVKGDRIRLLLLPREKQGYSAMRAPDVAAVRAQRPTFVGEAAALPPPRA